MNAIRRPLRKANLSFAQLYPGDSTERQPIHTVYGGAHLFQSTVMQKLSAASLRTLETYAPTAGSLHEALFGENQKWSLDFQSKVYSRVLDKLKKEAVEDYRIDFEDGYGNRPDAEEDGHTVSSALEVAKGMKEKVLSPFIGIRIKPFNEENIQRSIRTLDLFISTLLDQTHGILPSGFVVTLPKVTVVQQTKALSELLALIEKKRKLKPLSLKFEIMVETPQSIFDSTGRNPLRSFIDAGSGRCIGVHFGAYDYTAGCNITAAHQKMSSPACDFARNVMQVSLAGLPVFLSDGATNILPVGPHRELKGTPLTPMQVKENQQVVHRAWQISYPTIYHSLSTGFYQGWDLHPAQLPIRYATTYAFFLEGLEAATQRLKSFMDKAAKATLLGDVFDDAATGQGLLNFFLKALSCGAITEQEALASSLTVTEIKSRSFLSVLQGRGKRS